MNVTKLKLVCDDLPQGFTTLAYLYPGEAAWRDPHGGDFTAEEQRQMFGVAEGDFAEVFMHAGTKHQKMLTVRLAADFG